MKNRKIAPYRAGLLKMVRMVCAICFAVAVLVQLPLQAADTAETDGYTLTIKYTDGDTPLPGVQFDIYRVGSLGDDFQYHLTENFAGYPVDFTGISEGKGDEIAAVLAAYIQRDGISPYMTQYTDDAGYARFGGGYTQTPVEAGVYLVIGHPATIAGVTYRTIPFVTILPAVDPATGEVSGNITMEPKNVKDPPPQPGDETTTKKVLKIWDDAGLEESRPESVVVQLLRNGVVYDTVILSAENNWRFTWESLPLYDENGVRIQWMIVERGIPGYTVTVDQESNTFVLTNHVETPTDDDISVVKKWRDSGFEEERPSEVVVWLLKNGEVYDTVTLHAKNGWRWDWHDLPMRDEQGAPILWQVMEKPVPGYTGEITGGGSPFYITNTREPTPETPPPETPIEDTTQRSVHKIWQIMDGNGGIVEDTTDGQSTHPSSVLVRLYKNGELYDTVVLNAASSWTYTWSGLPMYDTNGSLIEWSIDEVPVQGYTTEIMEENGVFTVKNTIIMEQPREEELPQTGVLWWPVPIFAGIGIALILAGGFVKKGKS